MNYSALYLAAINENEVLINYLLKFGASFIFALNKGIIDKDLKTVKFLIACKKEQQTFCSIHSFFSPSYVEDLFYLPPLFLAIEKNNFEIFKNICDYYLEDIENTVFLKTALNYRSYNVVEFAKYFKADAHIVQHLKKASALSRNYLENVEVEIKIILLKNLEIAKERNKKILLLLGEKHFDYKVNQVLKKILKVAYEIGITHFYVESDNEADIPPFPIYNFAIRNGFKLEGIDMPDQEKPSFFEFKTSSFSKLLELSKLSQRNEYMANMINGKKNNAVVSLGALHIFDFYCEAKQKINNMIYHIIPINLASLYKKAQNYIVFESSFFDKKIEQNRNPDNIIQMLTETQSSASGSCFSPRYNEVIKKWNTPHLNLKEENSVKKNTIKINKKK